MTLVAVKVGAASKPGVETGIGSASSPCPSRVSVLAFDDHLVARRVVDDARRDRMGDRVFPFRSISSTGAPMPIE